MERVVVSCGDACVSRVVKRDRVDGLVVLKLVAEHARRLERPLRRGRTTSGGRTAGELDRLSSLSRQCGVMMLTMTCGVYTICCFESMVADDEDAMGLDIVAV